MTLSRAQRMVLLASLALVAATAAYAFTAANTVPDTKAGIDSGTISGYTVTSVAYTLDATDPSTIESVAFDVGATAGTVKARVVSTAGYTSCTNTGGTNWSCNIEPDPTVLSANELSIIAVE